MKVSVNNHNKPAPIAGAFIGGLMSALGGIGKTLSEQSFQEDQSEKQRTHDVNMSEFNQKHIKEQMSIANQYQIEQWERENEYNNPAAVLARYSQAGISPYAALSSVSGAGIAGGLSSAPSGSSTGSASQIRGHISFPDVAGLMQVSSQVAVNEAQADLLTAKAEATRNEIPTYGTLGDSKKANMDSQTALNDMLYQTEQEKQKNLISERDYNVAKTALTRAQTTQQEWTNKFDKETYDDRVQSLRYDLLSAVQAYNFNDSKNPLILKDLKMNIATQTVGLLATQVQMRLAEEQISLTQQQVVEIMAKSSLLTEQAKAITAKVAMEKELQPYRKAQVISGIVNDSLGTIIDGVKVVMTGGLAPTGSKNNGDKYESKLPSSVNGTDIDDFLLNVAAF